MIVVDNSHFTARSRAMAALRVLNPRADEGPRKSVVRVSGRMLLARGPAAARETLDILRRDPLEFALHETELDALGYDLMGEHNPFNLPEVHHWPRAVETLRLATELFPSSGNTWDS